MHCCLRQLGIENTCSRLEFQAHHRAVVQTPKVLECGGGDNTGQRNSHATLPPLSSPADVSILPLPIRCLQPTFLLHQSPYHVFTLVKFPCSSCYPVITWDPFYQVVISLWTSPHRWRFAIPRDLHPQDLLYLQLQLSLMPFYLYETRNRLSSSPIQVHQRAWESRIACTKEPKAWQRGRQGRDTPMDLWQTT